MVIDVSDQDFEDQVIKSTQPVLVDLWAPWCGPCRMVDPVIDKLAEKYQGRFKFCRLNIDENPKTPAKYRVMSIPTLIFFKGIGQQMKWSVRDESLHSKMGCRLFRDMCNENNQLLNLCQKDIIKAAETMVNLETKYIDKMFEMGDVEGI